jgi:signal transduction histidine kinase
VISRLASVTVGDALIGELRTAAFRLGPPDLDDLGLMASLERLAAEASKHGTAADLTLTKTRRHLHRLRHQRSTGWPRRR